MPLVLRRRRFTEEQRRHIANLYEQGYTAESIAEDQDCTFQYVYRCRDEFKDKDCVPEKQEKAGEPLQVESINTQLTEAEAEVLSLRNSNWTANSIAKKIKNSTSYVYNILGRIKKKGHVTSFKRRYYGRKPATVEGEASGDFESIKQELFTHYLNGLSTYEDVAPLMPHANEETLKAYLAEARVRHPVEDVRSVEPVKPVSLQVLEMYERDYYNAFAISEELKLPVGDVRQIIKDDKGAYKRSLKDSKPEPVQYVQLPSEKETEEEIY